jgi:pyruvate,water dikinase
VLLAERAVPDDVSRILASAGTLTLSGSVLSHVSLLSREFGKPSVSLVGVTPARFARGDETGLLVLEDVVGGTAKAVLDEGDVVFVDGRTGTISIPGGLDALSRRTVRRVFASVAAFGKLPEDESLLDSLLASCPSGDPVALAFLLEAALPYRLVPPGLPARRLLQALSSSGHGEELAARCLDLAERVLEEVSSRCEAARSDFSSVEDVDELQRALRRFEGELARDLTLLDDLGADPDRLESNLEPVLSAAAARRGLLEARLVADVSSALALTDEALRARLGGLFRLLRRARAAKLTTDEIGRLHRRLTHQLSEERARAGTHLVVPVVPGASRDRSLVGGKAAGLIDVLPALPSDCRVPRGFVVTSAAYRLHLLGETGERLRLALEAADDNEISRRARAAILSGDIPEEVLEALHEAARDLGGSRLAVRSSATIEDGPVGSLAGLFDTYLGVQTFEELVDRVRWAWASLWSGRAIAGLFASGLSPLRASQAVLVQEMVTTRAAGVLFSRDPSGRPDAMLVNAAWGLGEGVSQGEIPGDLYWLRRSTGELLASETGLAERRIDLASKGVGTVEVPLDADQRGRPCLAVSDLGRLAALARSLEEVTGRAQDVEFGFDGSGGLVVFQMRRIVTRPAARA